MAHDHRAPLLVMLLVSSGACGGGAPHADFRTVRDSSGVHIVEYAAEATPAQRWSMDLATAVEYRMPEGDPPLFRVSGAVRLEDGRVVVADAGNSRLVEFDPAGSVRATLGGAGQGPGEFQNMSVLGPWVGDSLVVWDDRARRLSVITPNFMFARSFGLVLPDGVPFARVLGVYPDGSFLGMSFPTMGQPPRAGLVRSPIRLHHFAADGSPVSTVGAVRGTEVYYVLDDAGTVEGLYPPHFYREGNHLAGPMLLEAPNDTWELTYRSADGDTVRIVRWNRAPTRVTDDDVSDALDLLIERTREARRAATRSMADELDIHRTMPAFDGVFYDRTGRTWIQEYTRESDDPPSWTVIGPDGALLAETSLPRSWQLRDAGEDWAIVRVTDELGVERLWLTSIAREPSTGDR